MNLTSLRATLLAALLCLLPLAASAAPTLAQTRFTDQSGSSVSLRAYQGKVVLVNFWATWCSPCREEMPMLNALRERLAPKGVEVVGVALDNKTETYNFARQLKINYHIVLGDSDTLSLLRSLGNPAGALPYSIILDRNGKQVGSLLGRLNEKNLEDTLRHFL